MFQFWDLKTQQRYIFQKEAKIFKWKFSSSVESLQDFLETFDKATKCLQTPLPRPEMEIGSTKSKNKLFVQKNRDVIQHPHRQICLSFPVGHNNSCVFSIQKFGLRGNQLILTEVFNFNYCESHHLYKNRSYLANKCESNWTNYDVYHTHPSVSE